MGISWAHVLGDAASCLRFLNTISRLYQKLEPLKPDPVFERRLWYENEADQSFLPAMKLLRDAQPREQMAISFMSDLAAYEQINLQFSGQQLAQLHKLTGEASVTIQDVLTAYFIILLNTYCFENDEQRISHTGTIINFRRVSDSISPLGYIGNSVFLMFIQSCEKTFLEPYLATMDDLMRKITRENRECRIKHYPNEIIVNSNLKYDWVHLVDFGHTDKCRFHTRGAGPFYLRVYRLNPIHDGTHWIERDNQGAEVAFMIDKDIKSRFMNAWYKDIDENFAQWKK